ncbi:MAG TPA: glycogen debranching enzyme N-terminal domain-containing protein, partial [Nitrospiria bacterium]|nr:glycogen debranching enzyme N-terminal domain-containing protein [Nitrospiria bacterium]
MARSSRNDADPLSGTIVLGRDLCGELPVSESREWLVTNGIGGYASGTVAGLLTRRYHGILMAALNPPLGRTLLVAKLDDTALYDGIDYPLFTNRWADGTVEPHGYRHIEWFALDGTIPTWRFACADALIEKRVWMQHGANTTYVRYDVTRGSKPVTLTIKALVNARQDHGTTRGNGWTMRVEAAAYGVRVTPYDGAPTVVIDGQNASVEPAHAWHRAFDLSAERERGLDHRDDHLHAATFRMTLAPGGSLVVTASAEEVSRSYIRSALTTQRAHERMLRDRRRTATPGGAEAAPKWIEQLTLAADQFIVRRATRGDPDGRTIIAGYPWFGDWGRDTMIALQGLTLATGRPDVARGVLTTFA